MIWMKYNLCMLLVAYVLYKNKSAFRMKLQNWFLNFGKAINISHLIRVKTINKK